MGLFSFGNRRKHYRTTNGFSGELDAGVISGDQDGDEQPAEVLDTSFGGCALLASPELVKAYPAGSRAFVRFTRVREGDDQLLAIEVIEVVSEGDQSYLRCKFVNTEGFASRLSEAWWRYFNRRACLRVPCRGDQSASVRLLGSGVSIEVALADLSLDGFGARLTPDQARGLQAGQEVRAAVTLANPARSLRFVARTVHVAHRERRIILGCAFEPDRTSEYPAQQDVISRWVGAWQQAQLVRREE